MVKLFRRPTKAVNCSKCFCVTYLQHCLFDLHFPLGLSSLDVDFELLLLLEGLGGLAFSGLLVLDLPPLLDFEDFFFLRFKIGFCLPLSLVSWRPFPSKNKLVVLLRWVFWNESLCLSIEWIFISGDFPIWFDTACSRRSAASFSAAAVKELLQRIYNCE